MTNITAQRVLFPGIDPDILRLTQQAEADIAERFVPIRQRAEVLQYRVLEAFRDEQIAVRHLSQTTGYGYGDEGRDALERVYAKVFGAEDALVRPQFASGTHTLAVCLRGLLRPGYTLLSVTGKPYDTLDEVIGVRPTDGSLVDWGVRYDQIELKGDNGDLDADAALSKVAENPEKTLVYIQRSRGYSDRRALSSAEIGAFSQQIHHAYPNAVVMVDNCYGEFTQYDEPTALGADVIAGSLIKNPGGGIAPTGGYVAGTAACIDKISYALTAPGIGREVGSWASGYAPFYQGFFLAPHMVGECLMGLELSAEVLQRCGFDVLLEGERNDIIQTIRFGEPQRLIRFCQGIQAASPIDAHVVPEAWDMPGYDAPVIMAAGTFVGGSSLELSMDAPIKPPYIAYMQGGLTYAHHKIGLMTALTLMKKDGLL